MGITAAVAIGGAALSYDSARKARNQSDEQFQQQQAMQQKQLEFEQKKYADDQALYGGVRQKMVDMANEGVKADLTGVANRVSADAQSQFDKQRDEQNRNLNRYGINPNSARAISANAGLGVAQAASTTGLINNARTNEQRYADETTWNRRLNAGNMGNNTIANDANGVNNSMGDIASNYGANATRYSNSADAAMTTAGNFAGIGLSAAYKAFKPATTNPA